MIQVPGRPTPDSKKRGKVASLPANAEAFLGQLDTRRKKNEGKVSVSRQAMEITLRWKTAAHQLRSYEHQDKPKPYPILGQLIMH